MSQDKRFGREYGTVPEYADNVTVSENRDNVIATYRKKDTLKMIEAINKALIENERVMLDVRQPRGTVKP